MFPPNISFIIYFPAFQNYNKKNSQEISECVVKGV